SKVNTVYGHKKQRLLETFFAQKPSDAAASVLGADEASILASVDEKRVDKVKAMNILQDMAVEFDQLGKGPVDAPKTTEDDKTGKKSVVSYIDERSEY
ncbi:MAG TPA: hypothetical protein V6C97_14235, partial [Oculatellaceae cyanobacterium]